MFFRLRDSFLNKFKFQPAGTNLNSFHMWHKNSSNFLICALDINTSKYKKIYVYQETVSPLMDQSSNEWYILLIQCFSNCGQKRKESVVAYPCGWLIILSGFILVPVPTHSQFLICPKCGSQLAMVSNYCNFCGAPLRQQIVLKICPRCKTRIPEAANFCPECGQEQWST